MQFAASVALVRMRARQKEDQAFEIISLFFRKTGHNRSITGQHGSAAVSAIGEAAAPRLWWPFGCMFSMRSRQAVGAASA
jgi:hypothetical protein